MRAAAALFFLAATSPVLANTARTVAVELKNHRFTPATVTVRAGERIIIQLNNRDMATEEFDSRDLHVERLVTPGGRTSFQVGPLTPGDYSFMGEFHPATAQGRVVVTP